VLIPLTRLALKALPDATGFTITRSLAAVTQRPQVTDAERAALASANRMQYGDGNVAWAWGGGPPVVLVHGWSGRAAQMAPLAARISEYGFRAIAMDVSGHGDSPGRRTEWGYFLRDIPALSDTLGEEVYAYTRRRPSTRSGASWRRARASSRATSASSPASSALPGTRSRTAGRTGGSATRRCSFPTPPIASSTTPTPTASPPWRGEHAS
jgi:hypothetical protein